MADENQKLVPNKRAQSLSSTVATSSKLSNMPLSALLPKVGEIKDTIVFAEEFQSRLSTLQEMSSQLVEAGTDPEERKRRAAEESMLNQVIQWLSIQSIQE